MLRTFLLVGGFSILGFAERLPAQTPALYFPPVTGSTWATTDAATLGYCPARVDSLLNFIDRSNGKAFILLKDGRIVLEHYRGTFTQDSFWLWNSAGKSLTAFLVGMAKQEGLLELDEPTTQYLGRGWTSASPAQEDAITIRNQLTMTSGLDDMQGSPDCTEPACLQFLAPPDTRWAYHNAPYTLLDDVIEAASGQDLNLFQRQRLRTQTGIVGTYRRFNFNNVYISTARSMARFGLLMLADGVWAGRPILTDTAYLHAMTRPSQGLNPSYGYLWWLAGQEAYLLPRVQFRFPGSVVPAMPADAYAALGKNGQICTVIPSQGLVWVRMGDAPDGSGSLVSTALAQEIQQRVNALTCSSGTQEWPVSRVRLSPKPNPSQGQVSFTSSARIDVMVVFDALGRIVHRERATDLCQIDLTHLPPGTYVLRAETDAGPAFARLLLER